MSNTITLEENEILLERGKRKHTTESTSSFNSIKSEVDLKMETILNSNKLKTVKFKEIKKSNDPIIDNLNEFTKKKRAASSMSIKFSENRKLTSQQVLHIENLVKLTNCAFQFSHSKYKINKYFISQAIQ